jgi:hypothetical protein
MTDAKMIADYERTHSVTHCPTVYILPVLGAKPLNIPAAVKAQSEEAGRGAFKRAHSRRAPKPFSAAESASQQANQRRKAEALELNAALAREYMAAPGRKTFLAMCERDGVSAIWISRRLKQGGVPKESLALAHACKEKDPARNDLICALHLEGLSQTEIGRKLNVARQGVARILIQRGLIVRSRKPRTPAKKLIPGKLQEAAE